MGIRRVLKWLLIGVVVVGAAMLALRSYRVLSGPALQPWHTFVPAELHASDLDGADWARYLAQEGTIFESVRTEVSQKLEPGRAGADQPLLRGQPGLSGALRPGLEPLVCDGTRRQAARGRGAAARADRLAVQPAAHREALPRPRLRRDRRPPAGARHRAGRPDQRALGRLDGGHAAGRARGAPAGARPGAVAPGRVFERRRAGDEVRARRDRGPEAGRASTASC